MAKQIAKSDIKGNKFIVTQSESDIPNIFSDGFGPSMVGPAVTKLQLYSVTDVEVDKSGETVENREINLNITIPTRALIEFCSANLNSFRLNQSNLEKSLLNELEKIKKSLEGYNK